MKKLKRIFVYLLLAVSFCAAQTDDYHSYNILILNSYNLGLNWTQDMNNAILEYFQSQSNVSFQVEFLDAKINTIENLYEQYYEFLKIKYKKHYCTGSSESYHAFFPFCIIIHFYFIQK